MNIYAGPPAAARAHLEVDPGRADDYYLAEGAGIARRFTATADRVQEWAPLSGDSYETWVAGCDRDSGAPRGRLRTDTRAVRFVEVVVNGPKSWSLAAAVHPDIAAAHDAAQDRAAAEICAAAGSVSWLVFQHGWRWDTDGAWTRLTARDIEDVDFIRGVVRPAPAG